MLFDSHAHLDDEQFNNEQAEVIERAGLAGVTGIINVGSDMASSARSIRLAEEYDCIYAAVGIHPHELNGVTAADYEQLAEWCPRPEVVAVGEIGLDYYYDLSPRQQQQEAFIRQLDVARQMHLPVIVHNREAHADTMRILKTEGQGVIGVVHCFSGSWEMAEELLRMGWYLGFDGPVTFKNAARLPEIVQRLPLERMLLETDSPYLTPVPLRGKRNESANVRLVAEKIALLRNIELEDLAVATTENVQMLFTKINKKG